VLFLDFPFWGAPSLTCFKGGVLELVPWSQGLKLRSRQHRSRSLISSTKIKSPALEKLRGRGTPNSTAKPGPPAFGKHSRGRKVRALRGGLCLWLPENKKGGPLGAAFFCKHETEKNYSAVGFAGASIFFCLISLALSTSESASLSSEARSSGVAASSALRRSRRLR